MTERVSSQPEVNALGNTLTQLEFATTAARHMIEQQRQLKAAALDQFSELLGQTVPLQGYIQTPHDTSDQRTVLQPAFYEVVNIDPRGQKIYLLEAGQVISAEEDVLYRAYAVELEGLRPATLQEIEAACLTTANSQESPAV